MNKILSLCAAGSAALLLSACSSHPDRCIDDLECGTGAYSEERTVASGSNETYKVSNPVNEAAMPAPAYEPEPAPVIEPAVINEPVQGTADTMFDERLTK
ncbi:MAG: hypothetical protein AAF569_07070 [Pseudomonadota bacterium]